MVRNSSCRITIRHGCELFCSRKCPYYRSLHTYCLFPERRRLLKNVESKRDSQTQFQRSRKFTIIRLTALWVWIITEGSKNSTRVNERLHARCDVSTCSDVVFVPGLLLLAFAPALFVSRSAFVHGITSGAKCRTITEFARSFNRFMVIPRKLSSSLRDR